MTRIRSTTRQGQRLPLNTRTAPAETGATIQLETGSGRLRGRIADRLAGLRIEHALIPAFGVVFVTAVAILEWKLWRGGLGVPITYGGDANFYHIVSKTIADFGWFFTNPRLGAPYKEVLHDYPLGSENLNYVGIRILSLVSRNPFVINNLFTLLTFPAVFAATWFAFRRLRFSRLISCAAAIVYTLSPYHFFRSDSHLMLSAYFAVPLGCLLLYELMQNDAATEPASNVTASTSRFGLPRRFLLSRWFWIPILLGSSGAYHAVFFSYLAVVVGLVLALRHRDWRCLIRPLLCVALTLGVLLANNLPTIVYQVSHGPNHEAVERHLGENDIYGLQLAYLVLPIDNHRIPAFASFKEQLNDSISPLKDTERQSLGLVTAIGLVVSLGALLLAGAGSRRDDRWSRLRRQSGALNVAAILLATVGGFSTLVGLLGYLQVHAFTRMSIFIAFFSLVALAAAFESWRANHARGRWKGTIAVGLIGVCGFAAFDQTAVVPTHRREVAAAVASDRNFVHVMERQLGGKGQVFVLPLLESPEAGIADLGYDFFTDDLGKPAMFDTSLRWSWGAMKGRPEDLTPSYVGRPLESLLPDLAALGFDGIYIDRRGFLDNGSEIEARLNGLVGTSALVSDDGTKSFYDLRPYRRSLPRPSRAVRDAALHPVQLDWSHGFEPIDGDGQFYPQLASTTFGRWAGEDATLRVVNTASATRHLSIRTAAQFASPGAGTLEVRFRGTRRVFDLSETPSNIVLDLNVPHGTTTISFHSGQPGIATGVPGQQPVAFRLNNVWFDAPFVSATRTNGNPT